MIGRGLGLALALTACSGAPTATDAGFRDASIGDASIGDASIGDAASARSAHAAWPMPNPRASGLPSPRSYEVISPELVRDSVTALVWARAASGPLRTQAAALADCEALVLGDEDDFRLPSRIEWVSLLDPSRSPATDGEAFPDTAPEYHWTSSAPAHLPGSAYSVYLGGGETTLGIATRASALVRCVAGGAVLDGQPYVIEGDRVRDRGTGLVWSRAALPRSTWADASAACSAGGRLPSLFELQTIVDEDRPDLAIDLGAFPDATAEPHWTSTVRDAGEPLPWTVDFADGQTSSNDSPSASHVARCLLE